MFRTADAKYMNKGKVLEHVSATLHFEFYKSKIEVTALYIQLRRTYIVHNSIMWLLIA